MLNLHWLLILFVLSIFSKHCHVVRRQSNITKCGSLLQSRSRGIRQWNPYGSWQSIVHCPEVQSKAIDCLLCLKGHEFALSPTIHLFAPRARSLLQLEQRFQHFAFVFNMTDPSYPVFPVFSFLSFVLVLIPLPWHLQAWNAGTCLYMLWTAIALLNQFVNSIVWHGNALNPAPIWCDICKLRQLRCTVNQYWLHCSSDTHHHWCCSWYSGSFSVH